MGGGNDFALVVAGDDDRYGIHQTPALRRARLETTIKKASVPAKRGASYNSPQEFPLQRRSRYLATKNRSVPRRMDG